MGKIAVRAYDKKHKLVCRGIPTVVVWMIADANRELVKRPVFGVVVPVATKLFTIEGWIDVNQIAARFPDASP